MTKVIPPAGIERILEPTVAELTALIPKYAVASFKHTTARVKVHRVLEKEHDGVDGVSLSVVFGGYMCKVQIAYAPILDAIHPEQYLKTTVVNAVLHMYKNAILNKR